MTLGDKIRDARLKCGMTMDDLGKMIGVQKSAINKYEKGIVSDLKLSTIKALAKALNVSYFYLLDDDPDEDNYERLEALHQNPRLGILLDNTRKMKKEDVDVIYRVADSIMKERGGDD